MGRRDPLLRGGLGQVPQVLQNQPAHLDETLPLAFYSRKHGAGLFRDEGSGGEGVARGETLRTRGADLDSGWVPCRPCPTFTEDSRTLVVLTANGELHTLESCDREGHAQRECGGGVRRE